MYLKSLPANSINPVEAIEVRNFCNQLYAVERKLKEVSSEDRNNERQKQILVKASSSIQ